MTNNITSSFLGANQITSPYKLLVPVSRPVPSVDGMRMHVGEKWGDIKKAYNGWKNITTLALDFETNGKAVWHNEFRVVGIGLAWKEAGEYKATYISLKDAANNIVGAASYVQGILKLNIPLVAHNFMYDGTILAKYNKGIYPDVAKWDTYALAKHLATEDFEGQRWGLKRLMKDLLGWPESNEGELMEWLCSQGLCTSFQYKEEEGTWPAPANEKGPRWGRPNKGEMWQAPDSILGRYCMLDAIGALQLYDDVLRPCIDRFPEYEEYYIGPFWRMLKRLSESHLRGIGVSRRKMAELYCSIEEKKLSLEHTILMSPLVSSHAAQWNANIVEELRGREPEKTKKDGHVSSLWTTWWEKYKEALQTNYFDIGSPKQLQWLFYERMGCQPPHKTDSGEPSVDDKALSVLGPIGKAVQEYRGLIKLQGYVKAYLDTHIDCRNGEEYGVAHPGWKVPGTTSGRMAGSEPNFQQCFHPETEILTPDGWKNILSVTTEDLVWQVDGTTLCGMWTKPLAVTSREYKGQLAHYKNQRGEFKVTPDHRLLLIGDPCNIHDYNNRWEILAGDVWPRKTIIMSTSSVSVDDMEDHPLEEIWTALMIQADGSSDRQKSVPGWRMGLSLPQKVQKATELVGPSNHVNKKGVHSWYSFKFSSPLLNSDKTLNLSSLSTRQADAVAAALMFWDGHQRSYKTKNKIGGDYYTDVLRNAEEVQRYFVRAGWEAKLSYREVKGKNRYTVSLKTNSYITFGQEDRQFEEYEGKVGCLSVPSSYVLIRFKGQCFVIGQCPKNREFLSCFTPPPGRVWVDNDLKALENVIAAEITEDKALNMIYGPGSLADAHLHTAAGFPGLGAEVRKYYNPDAPTKEGVEAAKKHCKKLRDLGKTINYSQVYGIGAAALYNDLKLAGVVIPDERGEERPITLDQAKAMWQSYWDTYEGIALYKQKLLREWNMRSGWIRNALGRPLAVASSRLKDLFSASVQSTGHDILLHYVDCVEESLNEAGIKNWHFVIPDFHDETIVECDEGDGPRVAELMETVAYEKLNKILAGRIPHSGSSEIGTSLVPFKLEDE